MSESDKHSLGKRVLRFAVSGILVASGPLLVGSSCGERELAPNPGPVNEPIRVNEGPTPEPTKRDFAPNPGPTNGTAAPPSTDPLDTTEVPAPTPAPTPAPSNN